MSTRKAGNWNEYLSSNNTDHIWKELNRIVGQHKLSRYSTKYDQLVEEGKFNRYTDLTQELFATLLEKDRFKHYVDTEMTDSEIEMEISQIELTNILTLELRRRYPESYRISRRVLNILQSSTKFKRFDNIKYKRVSDHLYGLQSWDLYEVTWPMNADERVAELPYHTRDIRHAGCAGDSQIIISNEDLSKLVLSILKCVEAPLTVKQIRKYVMSKLTIMDVHLTPVESYNQDEEKPFFEFADTRHTPEQLYLKTTSEHLASTKVGVFLEQVWLASKQKPKQYNLMLHILRLYYLTPDLTQWDVSKRLHVSDSLISGYRKTIDALLQGLGFTTIEEASRFKTTLIETLENISKE